MLEAGNRAVQPEVCTFHLDWLWESFVILVKALFNYISTYLLLSGSLEIESCLSAAGCNFRMYCNLECLNPVIPFFNDWDRREKFQDIGYCLPNHLCITKMHPTA